MRFLVDMPLSPGLARWLAEQGHDAVHAQEVGLERASDIQIVQYASMEGRVVVTADLDYPCILAMARRGTPGLILYRGGNFTGDQMLEMVKRVLATVEEEALATSLIVVDSQRVRRRGLPL